MTPPTIVTLEQLSAHLRRPIEEEDAEMLQKLATATQFVCEYIADRNPADVAWEAEIEAWSVVGSPANPAPPIVVLAVLMMCADLDRYRGDDGDGDKLRQPGMLPLAVQTLLTRYRMPVLA